MVMSPVHQVWPNDLVRHSERGWGWGWGRRQGRQKRRWEDNIREWTGLKFAKSHRGVENRETMEETGYEVICGAPTTPRFR